MVGGADGQFQRGRDDAIVLVIGLGAKQRDGAALVAAEDGSEAVDELKST